MTCHITFKTNRLFDFANETKFWSAKSKFSNFKI